MLEGVELDGHVFDLQLDAVNCGQRMALMKPNDDPCFQCALKIFAAGVQRSPGPDHALEGRYLAIDEPIVKLFEDRVLHGGTDKACQHDVPLYPWPPSEIS